MPVALLLAAWLWAYPLDGPTHYLSLATWGVVAVAAVVSAANARPGLRRRLTPRTWWIVRGALAGLFVLCLAVSFVVMWLSDPTHIAVLKRGEIWFLLALLLLVGVPSGGAAASGGFRARFDSVGSDGRKIRAGDRIHSTPGGTWRDWERD